jgi:hypothetical protein
VPAARVKGGTLLLAPPRNRNMPPLIGGAAGRAADARAVGERFAARCCSRGSATAICRESGARALRAAPVRGIRTS